ASIKGILHAINGKEHHEASSSRIGGGAQAYDYSFTLSDVRRWYDHIITEISYWCESQDDFTLMAHPVVNALKSGKFAKTRSKARYESDGDYHRALGSRRTYVGEPKTKNKTCITPFISSVAQGLFSPSLLNISHYDNTPISVVKLCPDNSATVAIKSDGESGAVSIIKEVVIHSSEELGRWKKRLVDTASHLSSKD
ncbi:hypothetical protein EV182_008633, partial [Spiromyces aspiralis]